MEPQAVPEQPWPATPLCTLQVTLLFVVPVTAAKNCLRGNRAARRWQKRIGRRQCYCDIAARQGNRNDRARILGGVGLARRCDCDRIGYGHDRRRQVVNAGGAGSDRRDARTGRMLANLPDHHIPVRDAVHAPCNRGIRRVAYARRERLALPSDDGRARWRDAYSHIADDCDCSRRADAARNRVNHQRIRCR